MIPFALDASNPLVVMPPVVGDGVTSDTAAINGRLAVYAQQTQLPPLKYLIDGAGLVMPGGAPLVGASRTYSELYRPSDGTILTVQSTAWGAEVERLNLQGCRVAPTQNAVVVDAGAYATLRGLEMWGGKTALQIDASDCLVDDCGIAGAVYGVVSSGANWYRRCKIDDALGTMQYAFVHQRGATTGVLENDLQQCDFSLGAAGVNSLLIDDPQNNSKFSFSAGCTFSHAVVIAGAKWCGFSLCTFAAPMTVSPGIAVVVQGCVAYNPVTFTGAINGGGNTNITFA